MNNAKVLRLLHFSSVHSFIQQNSIMQHNEDYK